MNVNINNVHLKEWYMYRVLLTINNIYIIIFMQFSYLIYRTALRSAGIQKLSGTMKKSIFLFVS